MDKLLNSDVGPCYYTARGIFHNSSYYRKSRQRRYHIKMFVMVIQINDIFGFRTNVGQNSRRHAIEHPDLIVQHDGLDCLHFRNTTGTFVTRQTSIFHQRFGSIELHLQLRVVRFAEILVSIFQRTIVRVSEMIQPRLPHSNRSSQAQFILVLDSNNRFLMRRSLSN